jgi:hypothetical protein
VSVSPEMRILESSRWPGSELLRRAGRRRTRQ